MPDTNIKEKKSKSTETKSSPSLIILQWLTYAFWGWTIFFEAMLTSNVLTHYIINSSDNTPSIYAIAALLVLLPLSVICNYYYSKQESPKKTGAASVIMIIHSVLFVALSIGALIVIVFSIAQLLLTNTDSLNNQVALYTAIIVAILYSLLFVRVLNPARLAIFNKLFAFIMIAIIAVIITFGVIGPVNGAIITRDDRLIDNNLSTIQNSISNYVNNQDKLPADLSNIDVSGDAKMLADSNLVKYIPDSKPATLVSDVKEYYYQLCVTYKKPSVYSSTSKSYTYPTDSSNNGGYLTYTSTYDHPSGYYCYKLIASPTDYSSFK